MQTLILGGTKSKSYILNLRKYLKAANTILVSYKLVILRLIILCTCIYFLERTNTKEVEIKEYTPNISKIARKVTDFSLIFPCFDTNEPYLHITRKMCIVIELKKGLIKTSVWVVSQQ